MKICISWRRSRVPCEPRRPSLRSDAADGLALICSAAHSAPDDKASDARGYISSSWRTFPSACHIVLRFVTICADLFGFTPHGRAKIAAPAPGKVLSYSNAKNSQPSVLGNLSRGCFTKASKGTSWRMVPTGYSAAGEPHQSIRAVYQNILSRPLVFSLEPRCEGLCDRRSKRRCWSPT